MTLAGDPLAARCRRLSRTQSLVSLSDGDTFVLRRARIRDWQTPPSRRAVALSEPPILRAAKADLAGSYRLYASELMRQLEAGLRVSGRPVTAKGRPAYEIELAPTRPRVALLVDRRTLRPLAARFESRQLSGEAELAPPAPLDGDATC